MTATGEGGGRGLRPHVHAAIQYSLRDRLDRGWHLPWGMAGRGVSCRLDSFCYFFLSRRKSKEKIEKGKLK